MKTQQNALGSFNGLSGTPRIGRNVLNVFKRVLHTFKRGMDSIEERIRHGR